ncbi:MAG: HEPN domain-containing protein, partial [Candidatus Bathyarchaeia archaeon]
MRREAFLWLIQAERDLKKAVNDLRTEDWDSAAFWSQQAAEKSLKALLIDGGKVYRGHDLLEMAHVIRDNLGIDVEVIMDDLRELTIHYTISRYPNAANAVPSELYTKDRQGQDFPALAVPVHLQKDGTQPGPQVRVQPWRRNDGRRAEGLR